MTTIRASLFLVFILFISCGGTTTPDAASVFNSSHKAKLEDDLYWILGVEKRTATIDDIQRAYRRRAKETHPDKNSSPDADEEFRRVAAAFEILSNPILRKRYDARYHRDEQRKNDAYGNKDDNVLR
jgi:curved DNA-binding protein CbpA